MALGKKTLYFMVPANICLWGYIGYVLYSNFNSTELNFPNENPVARVKINEDTSSYQLSFNYSDPFLKEETINRTKQKHLNKPDIKDLVNPHYKNTPKVTPPSREIKYLGLIQNQTSGTATALISIDGKSFIIKKGKVVEGVNFITITDELIIAKIGKEKVTIKKF